jgi:hypothetical protein
MSIYENLPMCQKLMLYAYPPHNLLDDLVIHF